MLKKFAIIFGLSFFILFALFIFLRLTGGILLYTLPTESNEPTLKKGSFLIGSKLIQPKKLDFVFYNFFDSMNGRAEVYTKRLCAVSGDKVEIKNGVLYVNDNNIDSSLDLNYEYTVDKSGLTHIWAIDKEIDTLFSINESVHVIMSKEFVSKNNINAQLEIRPKDMVDEFVQKQWGKDWNADQFGPIVVPEGKWFVLGDSRHNSLDSRFSGFVNETDFRGTLVWKRD